MNTPLSNLMQTELSRKEFLGAVGIGLASVFGFSSLLEFVRRPAAPSNHQVNGFGAGAYGGGAR